MLSIMRTFLLSKDILWPISFNFKVKASKQRLLLFCCLIDVHIMYTVQSTRISNEGFSEVLLSPDNNIESLEHSMNILLKN